MANRPTGKKRNARQKVKARYTKAREDAQLAGVIETSPEGAVRNETVDPSTQGSQPLPGLVGQAVRSGWATPEHIKPRIVDEMVAIVQDGDMFPGYKIQAARVLQQGDQQQWERDNPEQAGKAKGGAKVDVKVNNQVVTGLSVLQAILAAPPEQSKAAQDLAEVEKGDVAPAPKSDPA